MAKLTPTQFLDRIEIALRGQIGPAERLIEDDGASIWWMCGEIALEVGVQTIDDETTPEDERGASVFFGGGEAPVRAVDEALEVLRAIISDEVVLVKAYAQGVVMSSELAPADDPGQGLLGVGARAQELPVVDSVSVFRWSGGGQPDA